MNIADTLRSLGACDEALAYAAAHTDPVAALAECPNRRWLTWLARALERRGYVTRQTIALCACASARSALRFVPDGELRPLQAIETTEAWARGEATTEQMRAAAAASAAVAAAAADDASWRTVRYEVGAEQLAITKRMLGPALISGLIAYADRAVAAEVSL